MNEINNFWNTCPRKLEFQPTLPCTHDCSWIINSIDYNNCFWTYIRENSRPDGTMKPLQPQEIAKLLGTTTAKLNEELLLAEEELKYTLLNTGFVNVVDTQDDDIEQLIMPEKELEDPDAFDIIIPDV